MRPALRQLIESIDQTHKAGAFENILIKFYKSASADLLIGFFFDGKDINTIAERQALFMRKSAGLPIPSIQIPPLKAPKEGHEKLPPILAGHFDRRLILLKQVLIESGLDSKQIQTWLDFEESFRAMVQS